MPDRYNIEPQRFATMEPTPSSEGAWVKWGDVDYLFQRPDGMIDVDKRLTWALDVSTAGDHVNHREHALQLTQIIRVLEGERGNLAQALGELSREYDDLQSILNPEKETQA